MTRREMIALAGGLTAAGSLGAGSTMGRGESGGVEERRRLLYGLLGDLPDRNRPATAEKIGEENRDGYILERLMLDLNGLEAVPAWLVRPSRPAGQVPAILFNHSHGGGYTIGKKEFLEGREYLSDPPYAEVVGRRGWVGLCIDHWVFGERSHTSEMDTFKAMLWQGRVLWGMMVYDSLKAVDYLAGRADVDASRLATLGISMGSTMAWWLAALDDRIKVTVDICCLTDFHSLLDGGNLGLHGVYYYVPGLLKYFTAAQINALIAPRAHLAVVGDRDPLTPPEGVDRIDAELTEVYGRLGHPDRWKLLRYDVGHEETSEARLEILEFLDQHL